MRAGAAKLSTPEEAEEHKIVTQAVHEAGGKICMQILHAGRYAYSPQLVAPSAIRRRSTVHPRELDEEGIEKQIRDFVNCATLAQRAGYDGVEIMGSEGCFINQFWSPTTTVPTAGVVATNRMRLPVEIVRRVREAVGPNFIIIYRLSMLDLIEGGSIWEEVVQLAKAIEQAGATLINTGIGWHEARIPTIATKMPRAFTKVTAKLRGEVNVPLITTNRINTPEVAEQVLAEVMPTWCPWHARSSPIRSSSTRRPLGTASGSIPASAATRPAGPYLQRQADHLLVNPVPAMKQSSTTFPPPR